MYFPPSRDKKPYFIGRIIVFARGTIQMNETMNSWWTQILRNLYKHLAYGHLKNHLYALCAMSLCLYIWKATMVSSGFIQLVLFVPYQKSHFSVLNTIIFQIWEVALHRYESMFSSTIGIKIIHSDINLSFKVIIHLVLYCP